MSLKAEKPLPWAYPRELRTLADHLRKRRLDLGFGQKEVAAQLGVDEMTVKNWERGRTKPLARLVPRNHTVLGHHLDTQESLDIAPAP